MSIDCIGDEGSTSAIDGITDAAAPIGLQLGDQSVQAVEPDTAYVAKMLQPPEHQVGDLEHSGQLL